LGYLGGLLVNRIGLPKVSGYVFIGILLSPTVTGVISHEFVKSSSVIVDFALAMVAYILGGNLRCSDLKKRSKSIFYVTIGQGVGAYVFVAVGTLIFLHLDFFDFAPRDIVALAFIFGALSLSTAPAATVATVHEYKAKGDFPSMLFAVVALDDALGLMGFALTIAFVKNFILDAAVTVPSLIEPFVTLLFSALLGISTGLVLIWLLKYVREKNTVVIFTIAFFCLTFGFAQQFNLEPLFATMLLGVTVANVIPGERPFMYVEKGYEVVVFAIFFVLAGAHIDLSLLVEYFPLAIVFAIFRLSGKWAGSFAGGMLSATPKKTSKYIGLALAPQAGIAIGLALFLERIPAVEQYSVIAINVIVAKTAINEIIGPYMLKFALKKTGAISS
jgi:Kef-type K+ transport system membrane component KefB